MKTRRHSLCAGVLLAGIVTSGAHADYSGAHSEHLGDLGAGVSTYRLYVDFSSPADQLLGIHGTADTPLFFESCMGDALRNTTGSFAGTSFEDTPFPGLEAWDSWVTLNADTGPVDVQFTPGFLGGDGTTSVIQGSSFSESDGGWFDSTPGQPETGESILIAQFTVAGFHFGGNLDWIGAEGVETTSEFFFAAPLKCPPLPAPGTLAALALPGLMARRRRRG